MSDIIEDPFYLYTQAPFVPVIANRDPRNSDNQYNIGQPWVSALPGGSGELFTLVGFVLGVPQWQAGSSSAEVTSIIGTANQIAASSATGNVALSIPSTFIAPGTIAATSTVTAPTGFIATTAGAGITLNSGTTSGTTTATLNGRSGQITITTPTINAGATFVFTITNSSVTASTTQILYGLTGGSTGSAITIQSVANTSDQSVVTLMNASTVTNNTASLVLTFLVLN